MDVASDAANLATVQCPDLWQIGQDCSAGDAVQTWDRLDDLAAAFISIIRFDQDVNFPVKPAELLFNQGQMRFCLALKDSIRLHMFAVVEARQLFDLGRPHPLNF